MKRKEHLLAHISAAADLQEEHIPILPLVEISGDRRVLVEHHRGVSEYGENQIGILVKYGTVCICGSHLSLVMMSKERLVVTGCIECIRLIRR